MAQCDKHAERRAVGTCRSCGKNLCDECVAQQKDGKILCYDCAVKVTLDDFDGAQRRDRAAGAARKLEAGRAAKKDARKGPGPFTAIVIVGVIIIFVQGGVILADYLMRNRAETSFIWSSLIEMRYERDACANNLHRIGALVEEYGKTHDGARPPDLGAVIGDAANPVLVCPSSDKPYVYTADRDTFIVSCPSPETHELSSLSSRNGTIGWGRGGQ